TSNTWQPMKFARGQTTPFNNNTASLNGPWTGLKGNALPMATILDSGQGQLDFASRHEHPRPCGEERAIHQTGVQGDVGLHLRHGDGGDLAEALSRLAAYLLFCVRSPADALRNRVDSRF